MRFTITISDASGEGDIEVEHSDGHTLSYSTDLAGSMVVTNVLTFLRAAEQMPNAQLAGAALTSVLGDAAVVIIADEGSAEECIEHAGLAAEAVEQILNGSLTTLAIER